MATPGGFAMAGSAGAAWITIGANVIPFVSGIGKAQKSLVGFQKTALKLMAVYIAIKKVTSEFVAFDKELKNTWTLLDASSAQMEKTGKAVRAMARNYQVGATEAMQALYHINSATFFGAEAMEILEEATRGAAAGLATLGSTGDMLTTVLNAYKMSASEAATVNDQLFTAIRYGKCLAKGTPVLLASGEIKPIEDVADGETIVSLSKGDFVAKESRWFYQGVKPIIRVETRLGRRIDTTATHPYLTPDGWKKVMDLSEGDKVAVPVYLPYFGNVSVPHEEAAFLGLWTAEGTGGSVTPGITTSLYADKLNEWSHHFGCHVVSYGENNAQHYISAKGEPGNNKCASLLRKYGVQDDRSIDKHIPDEVFTWDKESVATYLHWLFNGDGWLSRGVDKGRGFNHQLGIGSKSEKLIRQVNHLMLRFGVVGRVRERTYSESIQEALVNENDNKFWVWEVNKNVDIRRFLENIGIDREFSDEALNRHSSYMPEHGNSKLSYSDVDEIKRLYSSGEYSQQYIADKFDVCQQLISDIVRGKRHGESTIFPDSSEPMESFIYDEIVNIECIGEGEVYDLMVPGTMNFVASDVVAHNTTMGELASQVGRLAGVSAPVGASFSDMAAAIATLTRQGIRTDWAITSLRQTLMQFIKPVKNLKMALADLGYASGSALIKQVGFAEALKMVTKWAKENGVEMEQMFTNVRAITAVLPLATTAADRYALDIARMTNSAGAASEAFGKQTKSMSYQIQRFSSLMSDMAISIGGTLAPVLSFLMTVLSSLAKVLSIVFDTISKFGGKYVLSIAVGVGALAGAFRGLTAAVVQLNSKQAWLGLGKVADGLSVGLAKATKQFRRFFGMLAVNHPLLKKFTKNMSYLGVRRGAAGKFLKGKSALPMMVGLAGAAIGLGAGAYSIKQIIDIEPEFNIVGGKVTNVESLWDIIKSGFGPVLGAAIAGAILIPGVGWMAGAAIGAVTAAVGIVVKVFYEKSSAQKELDKQRVEELKLKFFAEFDFPKTGLHPFQVVSDFLKGMPDVPESTFNEIVKDLNELYNMDWNVVSGGGLKLKEDAQMIRDALGSISLSIAEGAEAIVSKAEDGFIARRLQDVSGGITLSEGELLSMQDGVMSAYSNAILAAMKDTVDNETLEAWMKNNLQVSIDNAVASLDRNENIDISEITAAIDEALEIPIINSVSISKRRKALANATEAFIEEGIPDEEIFAFIRDNYHALGEGVERSILEGLGKSFEDYNQQAVEAMTTFSVAQQGIEGLFDGFIGMDTSILTDLTKEFYDFYDAFKDPETEIEALPGLLDDMNSALEKSRKMVTALANAERISAGEADGLNDSLNYLEQKLNGVAGATDRAADAIAAFNESMAAVSLSNLLEGVGSSFEDLQQAFIDESNPVAAMQIFKAISSYVDSIPSDMEALQTGFLQQEGFMEGFAEKAAIMETMLGKLPYKMGTTYEQIAAEELKRLEEEKANADELADKQKQAADDAAQAASDAADAAQEAFREMFKQPVLEGIQSGDWKAARDTIFSFARSGKELMEFARNLSSANDQAINEADVLGLITGSFSDLQSTVDEMITMGTIAGESTFGLKAFKNSLEDLIDPIAGLGKKIREILGMKSPSMAGAEIRSLMEVLHGIGGQGFQSGGPVPGVGSGDIIPAMLEPGEFVVPKWMMKIPGLKYLLMRTHKKKFADGGMVGASDFSGISGLLDSSFSQLLMSPVKSISPVNVVLPGITSIDPISTDEVTLPSVSSVETTSDDSPGVSLPGFTSESSFQQSSFSGEAVKLAIEINTLSIVSAIKSLNLTMSSGFTSLINASPFSDFDFGGDANLSMPGFTRDNMNPSPSVSVRGFTSDESFPDMSILNQLAASNVDAAPGFNIDVDVQGEIDRILQEVRDAFAASSMETVTAADLSAAAIKSATDAVSAFANSIDVSSWSSARLRDEIKKRQDLLKSGTLTEEEARVVQGELNEINSQVVSGWKDYETNLTNQIDVYKSLGWETESLEEDLKKFQASIRGISVDDLEWETWLDNLDDGTAALFDKFFGGSQTIKDFLESLDPQSTQEAINQIVSYGGDVGSALFKIGTGIATGNPVQAVMGAVDLLVAGFKIASDAVKEFKEDIKQTFEEIKKTASVIWGNIKSASKIVKDVVTKAFAAVSRAAKFLWTSFNKVAGVIRSVVISSFAVMSDAAKFLWGNIVSFSKTVKKVAIKAFDFMAEAAKFLWGAVQSIAVAVKKAVVGAFYAMRDSAMFLLGAMKDVAGVIKRVAINAFGFITNAAKALWGATLNIVGSLNKIAIKAFGLILGAAKSLWKGISGISKIIKNAMSSVFSSMATVVKNIFGEISNVAKNLKNSFISLIQSTESYTELQSSLATIQSKVFGMMMGFLAPVAAVLNAFIGSIDSASESMQSLNVPTGYKVERAEWEAATPGEPGDKTDSDAMPSWLSGIMDGFVESIDLAAEKFLEFADILGQVWGPLAESIIPVVIDALSSLGDSLIGLGNHVLNDLMPIFAEHMPGVISDALNLFSGGLVGISTSLVDTLAGILPNLSLFMESVGDAGNALPALFASITNSIVPAINSLLEDAFIPLANDIANNLIPALVENLPGVISGAIEFIGGALAGVSVLFSDTLTGTIPSIENFMQAIGGAGMELPGLFSNIASSIIPVINSLLDDGFIPLVNHITNDLIPIFSESLPGVISGAIELFGGAIVAIGTSFSDTLAGILPGLESLSQAFGNIGSGLPGAFSGIADAVVPAFNDLIENAIIPLVESISSDLLPLLGEELPDAIAGAVDLFGGAIVGAATAFVDLLVDTTSSLSSFMSALGGIGQQLPGLFSSLADGIGPAINDLIENSLIPLANNISNNLIPVLTEELPNILSNTISLFGEATIGIADMFTDLLAGTLPSISNLSDSLGDFASELAALFDSISGPITDAANTLINTALIPLVNSITNSLMPVLTEELPGIISGAANLLSAVLGGVGTAFADTLANILPNISEFVEVLGSAGGEISELFIGISDSISDAINFLLEDAFIPLANDVINNLIPALSDNLPTVIGGAAELFAGIIGGIGEALVTTITNIMPNLALFSDSVGDIGLQLPELFSAISESLSASINFLLEDGLIPLANNIATNLIPALTEHLPSIINSAGDFFFGAVSGIANLFVDTLTNVLPSLDLLSESVGNIGTQLPELFSVISDSLSASINFLINDSLIPLAEKVAGDLIPVLTETLPSIVSGAADFFAGAVGGIANSLVDTLTAVLPNIALFSEKLGLVGQQLPEFFDAISEALGTTINNLIETGLIPLMDKIATKLIPVLTETLPSIITGAGDFFFGAVSGIANLFVDTLTNVLPNIALFSESVSAIGLQLPEFFEAMTGALSNSINSLLENGLIPLADNIATNLIPALTEYLPSVIEGAADFFFGAVSGIANTFVDVLTAVLPNIALFSDNLSAIGVQLPAFFAEMSDSISNSINFFLEEGLIPLTEKIATNLIPVLTETLPSIIEGAGNFFFGAVSGIANLFVDTLTNTLPNIALFSDNVGAIGLQLPAFFDAMTEAISSSINFLLEDGLIPLTDNIASNLIPALTEYLPSVIKGAGDFFFGAISGIANLFVTTLTNVLPNIALFSEKLSEIGYQLPEFFSGMSESVSYAINTLIETALIPLADNVSQNLIPVLADTLPSIITGAADFFAGAVGGIANFFVTTITNVLPSVALFSESLGKVGVQLPEFFDAMSVGVSNAINFLIDDGLVPLTDNIADNLIPALTVHLPNIVEGAGIFFAGAVTGIANGFVTTLTNVLPNVSLFSDNLKSIGKQLPAFFNDMAAAISPVINTLLEGAFIPLSNFVSNTLLPDLSAFLKGFGSWWKSEMDPFLQSEVFPTLGKWLKAVYDWIANTLIPFLKGPFFNAFKNDIWPVIKDAVKQLGGAFGDLGTTLTENMPAITEFVTSFIKKLADKWTGMAEKLEALTLTKNGKLWDGLEVIWDSKSLTLWDKVKTTIGLSAIALWDVVKKAFAPLGESLKEIGKAFKAVWDILSTLFGPVLKLIGKFIAGTFIAAIYGVAVVISLLGWAIQCILYPFQLIAVVIYNVYVAVNNAIQKITHLLNPFSQGNQLEYKKIPTAPGAPKLPKLPEIPKLAVGGYIDATGLALVHKGEVVAPAQTSPLGNYNSSQVIDNTIMLDGNVLYKGMKKVNRQEQLRRTGSSVGGRAWQGV